MLKAIEAPRTSLSAYAPKIRFMQINPDKMAEVIGSKGKVINRIIDESGVDKIETEDEGKIYILSADENAIEKAVQMIDIIANDFEKGRIYKGTVVRIIEIGAFVEIAPEKCGMVHISKLANERVAKVEDVVNIGDEIEVMCLGTDDRGRVNFSRKACL
jgi:polyribonucleotide nucleotidyltransferase